MFIHRIAAAAAAALAAVALAVVGATPAVAGSPHFIRNATTASLDGVSLVVDFKEAGLESGSVETITVTAHLDALFQCVNGGGNVPSDPKKTTISSDFSSTANSSGLTFTAGPPAFLHSCISSLSCL